MNTVQTLTCDKALTLFLSFIEKSAQQIKKSKSKNICSVLVGLNAKRFDVPVVLRNSNSSLKTKFQGCPYVSLTPLRCLKPCQKFNPGRPEWRPLCAESVCSLHGPI